MTGRVAVVTGGLQGIGLAIAAELSRCGASVAVGARRGDDRDLAAAAESRMGGPFHAAALDVQKEASIRKFLTDVEACLGPVDILVNAAGVTVHQPVDGHGDEDWQFVIDVNLTGPFRMIRACLPGMKQRGWGRIVNIASTAARVGAATHPAYCASKSGLLGLTRAVAQEGAPHGITCLSVSPGWVETEMLAQSAERMAARHGTSAAEEKTAMAAGNPQNRLVQPEEIAGLVAYCCSDMARGLTMEDIQVNAGALW